MGLFYPVDRQLAITDGTAAPGTVAVPVNLRNYTPFHRSGGEISVENQTAERGVAGRDTNESLYVRRQMVSISDQTLEQDDTAISASPAASGTNRLFDMSDALTNQNRIYQVSYRTGFTRGCVVGVGSVSDSFQDGDVLLMNVSLFKADSAAVHEVGW